MEGDGGKRKGENAFQYPVKGIAKIRILARFTSMVIICEESSVYKGCKSGKGNHPVGGRELKRTTELDAVGPACLWGPAKEHSPYENKTNKSRASDVYVMGNEIGCWCDDLFLARRGPTTCFRKCTAAAIGTIGRPRSAHVCVCERPHIARRARAPQMRYASRWSGLAARKNQVRHKEKYPIYSCRSKGKYLEQKGRQNDMNAVTSK